MAWPTPNFVSGVGEDAAIECDLAHDWFTARISIQAGQEAQQHALARARGAEDHSPIGRETALDLEEETAAAGFEVEFKHVVRSRAFPFWNRELPVQSC